jgi:hypothetical protein
MSFDTFKKTTALAAAVGINHGFSAVNLRHNQLRPRCAAPHFLCSRDYVITTPSPKINIYFFHIVFIFTSQQKFSDLYPWLILNSNGGKSTQNIKWEEINSRF